MISKLKITLVRLYTKILTQLLFIQSFSSFIFLATRRHEIILKQIIMNT